MEQLMAVALEQFQASALKNIHYRGSGHETLSFSKDTRKAVEDYRRRRKGGAPEAFSLWIGQYLKFFKDSFRKVSQYADFSKQDEGIIRWIYACLLMEIGDFQLSLQEIERRHYDRMRVLLGYTNPAFSLDKAVFEPAAEDQEYVAHLQLELFGVDNNLHDLREPVLDIGCGKNGSLVKYLRLNGLDAFGLDRRYVPEKYFTKTDWLNYEYGEKKWGAIFAHYSFSSHFLHHANNNPGLDVAYARAYMNILHSLQTEGLWYYAPSLPFMEVLLPQEEYLVLNKKAANGVAATAIQRTT